MRLYSAPAGLHNAGPDFPRRSALPLLRVEFGDYCLRASWWMTALTLAGVLIFAQLGRWQWHRAAEQRARAAAFAAGSAEFTSALGPRSTAELARYIQVRVRGRYDAAHQFLLDNMSHGGRSGYQVLTPLRLGDGRLLLVNRGWVPLPGGRRDVLPDVSLPGLGQVQISGRLDELPVTGLASGQAVPSADDAWPKRTSFPTMEQLGAALGETIEARQLLLAAAEPQGFTRDWQASPPGFGPGRYVAYAFQWWALGALSLFLYLFLNRERESS